MIFPNVSSGENDPHGWRRALEGLYLERFFLALSEFSPEWFVTHRFAIYKNNTIIHRPNPPAGDERTILLWLSDEGASVPTDICGRYKAILKSYWPLKAHVKNIYPFPLCGSTEVLDTIPTPWEERVTDIFFSGNFSPNRVDFLRAFTILRHFPPFTLRPYIARRLYYSLLRRIISRRDFSEAFSNARISFTGGFGQGLAPTDYAQQLSHSKIALCPEGFRSPECIRHFEAMSQGCVIVAPEMPPNRFYLGSPIVQLKSWTDLRSTLHHLLTRPNNLYETHKSTLNWWNSVCSPSAMAKYLLKNIIQ